ncbi:MAG: hypothetical protein IJ751_02800, partial [Oscillospiraceae bacterium]|nr:hypothetical protein [Oscillospiraceae bacterium]
PDMAGMLLQLPNSVIISPDAINRSLQSANMMNEHFPAIPIQGTEGKARVGVATRTGHYHSEAAKRFLEMVEDFYQSLPQA